MTIIESKYIFEHIIKHGRQILIKILFHGVGSLFLSFVIDVSELCSLEEDLRNLLSRKHTIIFSKILALNVDLILVAPKIIIFDVLLEIACENLQLLDPFIRGLKLNVLSLTFGILNFSQLDQNFF